MLSRERELRAQQEAEATLEHSEFLENFSHEIRNPLTSIVGFAQLLDQAGGSLSPELKQSSPCIFEPPVHVRWGAAGVSSNVDLD